MSRHSYSSFTRRRLPLLLALLTVFSTFTEHVTASSSVDGYHFNKRERVHSRLHSRDISTWDSLLRRADDPYSCSADRPCSNGACCGKDGWCGYAEEYCGDGCLANCDAKAECGEYAEVPGAACPINVCCSEFGFCGTTEEFCGTGCQNGCEQPGPGAAWGGDVRDIVIGYYEAWTAGAAGCGGSVVDNIPVQGLTHLFFSFGFIEPDTYNIIPMPGIAESAFSDVVNTKQRNPDLKVYIALGGWTHNDNGTIWQPVFSDLVSTQAKRTKFINGLLTFLAKWGFDGVDFDWEYPGAGDRGGQEDDGVNFTTMLKELKAAISAGSKNYGVTFTAPTSFWYLQHFDLEAMMQYVDWMNMMSYDLHGEWDAQNPIGARVLAHTNLTEINLALNLMWRNNVPPSQIVMGFGFYGRTFTLGDASCTQPGCAFVAGGAAGPCTGTAGYLSYKEILQILDATDAYTTYDEVNAVKYFTYDSVNWVSFDDQVTLKQKVDFASSLGLRGMMIWAIDLDDDSHTALQSLVYPRALDWAYSGSPASSISSTPTSVAVPGPTQAGVTTSCSKYHVATSTDYCYLIWTTYGITAAQFQAWNPATGSDTTGADCSVWYTYAYCVGVSTSSAGATSGVVSTSVASGNTAGATSGVVSSVASGNTAGATSGVVSSVASGNTAGPTSGAATSVASGNTAGPTSGAGTSVASGNTAGPTSGAGTSVASGVTAGATTGAGGTSVASGDSAGATAGAGTSVGTGNAAGGTSGANDGATGVGAGGTSGATSVAAGAGGGATSAATGGTAAGTLGGTSVATGVAAGGTTGGTSVATGVAAGGTSGAGTSVATGVAAGGTTGAGTSVATGVAAGGTTGAGTSVGIGGTTGATSVATGVAAGGTSAAATSSTPTSGAAAPGATQAGTTSSCTKWHLAGTGDYCYAIWQTYGITGAQFYAWNTGTGTDASGSDCSVWFNYAYCVGV